MLTAPATPLPPFDQAQLDKRFLTELARLLDAEAFASYRDWARVLGVSPSYLGGITQGRYHANLKLLYATVRHYPTFDFQFVVFGSAVYARPEPAEVPKRVRGRRPALVVEAPSRKRGRPSKKSANAE